MPPILLLRGEQFKDGLVRLCTEEYVRPSSSNLDERCMHLTNYAINKFSEVRQQAWGGGGSGVTESAP